MHALAAATRSWPMLAALGAGLVLLALAAGAGGMMQPAFVVVGVAALGWGVLALRAGRVIAPSVVLVVAAASLVGAGAAVATGTAAMTDVVPGPLAAASVFTVVVAFAAGLALRARRGPASAGRAPSAADPVARGASAANISGPGSGSSETSAVLGLLVGAVLVAALAAPALAATEAGQDAVPHGSHRPGEQLPLDVDEPGGHTH
jgi:lysylphosphatidylglycerol synthetase-like protein (DUF2156 family)